MSNVPNALTTSERMRGNSVPSISINDLKSDSPLLETFLLEKLKDDSRVIKYASDRLKNNKNFLLEAVKQNYLLIRFIPELIKILH